MKKNIVLKILTGVITTGLTVTGITVSATTYFNQNTDDVFMTADEEQEAETAYVEEPKYNNSRSQAPAVVENKVPDEQVSDGQTPVDAVEITGHAATKKQAAADEKSGNTVSTASTGKATSGDTTANTGKTSSDVTAMAPDTATASDTGKTSNTDTTANADKISSDKTRTIN